MTSEDTERKYKLRRRLEALRTRLDHDYNELSRMIADIADKYAEIDADRESVRRQWLLIRSVTEEMTRIQDELRALD